MHRSQAILELPADREGDFKMLAELVYPELRQLAARRLLTEGEDHPFTPTDLVHEAFVRMAGTRNMAWRGRVHFFAVAATTIRRILIQHARARERRGGGIRRLTSDSQISEPEPRIIESLDLKEALDKLARQSTRQSLVARLRLLCGLTVAECAQALAISARSVERDWTRARTRLLRGLGS